jgi:hypothetical protein
MHISVLLVNLLILLKLFQILIGRLLRMKGMMLLSKIILGTLFLLLMGITSLTTSGSIKLSVRHDTVDHYKARLVTKGFK